MKQSFKRRLFAVMTALLVILAMLPRGTLAREDENESAEGTSSSEEAPETFFDEEASADAAKKTERFFGIAEDSILSEEELSVLDFSSGRLMIAGAEIIDPEHVLSGYEGMFLLQYEDDLAAKYAYSYYYGKAAFISPDSVISVADGESENGGGTDEMTEERNPFSELNEAVLENDTVYSGSAVALIDTGVNGGANIAEAVSMIGDAADDDNGHGSEMAALISEQNPDVRIVSIKAFGSDGTADVSAVYAAFRYAIEKQVSIISFSAAAVKKTENALILSVIEEAVQRGIQVVGAAGNYSADAKFFVPGASEQAFIIGASGEDGLRLPSSNFGETVDYNVYADSTSKAAAIYTGLLSAGKGAMDYQLVFPTEDDPLYEELLHGTEDFTVQIDRDPAIPARYEQQLSEGVYRYDVRNTGPVNTPEFGSILSFILRSKFAETYGWNYPVRAQFDYGRTGETIWTTIPSIADAVTFNWNWKRAESIDGHNTRNDVSIFMNHIWKSSSDPNSAEPVYCYDYAANDLGARTEKPASALTGIDTARLAKAYTAAANLSADHFALLKANLTAFFRDYDFSDTVEHNGQTVQVSVHMSADEIAREFASRAASAGDDPYQTIVQYIVWYIMHNAEIADRQTKIYIGAGTIQGKEGPAWSDGGYWYDTASSVINPEALIGIGYGASEPYTVTEVSQGETGDIAQPGAFGGQLLILTVVQSGHAKIIKTSSDPALSDGNGSYSLEGIQYAFFTDPDCTVTAEKFGTDEPAIVTLNAAGESEIIELSADEDGTVYYVKEYYNPPASNFDTSDAVLSETISPGEFQIYRPSDSPVPGQAGVIKKYTEGDRVPLIRAEYGLYADPSCASAPISTVTVTQNDIMEGIGALKIFPADLAIGTTYYVREISVMPAAISADTTGGPNGNGIYPVTAAPGITSSSAASVAVSTDRLNNGFLKGRKVSANPEITQGNRCYSLEGIEFRVYTSQACNEEALDAFGRPVILGTDGSGITQTVEMTVGEYWVREVPESVQNKGWAANETPVKVVVTADNTAGTPAVFEIRNSANSDPIGILLRKADKGRGTEGRRVAL